MEATGKRRAKPLRRANRIQAYLVKWHGVEGEVAASRAGLSPGHWPTFVTVGKGVYYLQSIDRDERNRVTGARYVRHDDDARTLRLLNS